MTVAKAKTRVETRSVPILRPDYVDCFTAQDAEQEYVGFKFEGPGWYYTKTDTVLAEPVDRDPNLPTFYAAKFTLTERFMFYVWNSTEVSKTLNRVINAPTRTHED